MLTWHKILDHYRTTLPLNAFPPVTSALGSSWCFLSLAWSIIIFSQTLNISWWSIPLLGLKIASPNHFQAFLPSHLHSTPSGGKSGWLWEYGFILVLIYFPESNLKCNSLSMKSTYPRWLPQTVPKSRHLYHELFSPFSTKCWPYSPAYMCRQAESFIFGCSKHINSLHLL